MRILEKIINFINNKKNMTNEELIKEIEIIDLDYQKYLVDRLKTEILFAIDNAEKNKNIIQTKHLRNAKFISEELERKLFDYIEDRKEIEG